MFCPVLICSMYLPREPYSPEIRMGPRVTSTFLVSFGPLVCTALSAWTFNNNITCRSSPLEPITLSTPPPVVLPVLRVEPLGRIRRAASLPVKLQYAPRKNVLQTLVFRSAAPQGPLVWISIRLQIGGRGFSCSFGGRHGWVFCFWVNFVNWVSSVVIPVTRKVKGYTIFVGKYVTDKRERFRPHKVHVF